MQEVQLRVLTAEECKRIYKEKYNGETDPSPSQICVIQSQSVCRVSDIFIWLKKNELSDIFVLLTGRQWRTFNGGYYPNRHCQLRRRLQLRSAPNLHPGFDFCRKRMDRWETGKLKIYIYKKAFIDKYLLAYLYELLGFAENQECIHCIWYMYLSNNKPTSESLYTVIILSRLEYCTCLNVSTHIRYIQSY